VNMHIERVHRVDSNGGVRKQSKRRTVNRKTLGIGLENVLKTIGDRRFNDSVVKQEIGIINSNSGGKNIKLENMNHNVAGYDCEEVYALKEEVERGRRENIKLNHELRTVRTAESVLKESFDMAMRNWTDYEGMLKERTEELAMSNKIRLYLKNQMREDRRSIGKSLSESLASLKEGMLQDILTENVFKTETVRDFGSRNMTISTEGFETYINQIFIRLCGKYFQCLNSIV
jgi:hypothetical protein